jgi:uncharacterized membrane protein
MISLYALLVFVHISAAVIWLGSAFAFEFISLRLGHAGAEGRRRHLFLGEWFGPRIFMPASILTILSGILLVVSGGWHFTRLWIMLALGAVIIAAAIGGGIIGRTMAQLGVLAREGGHENEIEAKLARLRVVSYVELAILFLILLDMVMKPSF